MKKILFILLFLFLFPSWTLGATYYVDGSCPHNGDGTVAACADTPGGVGNIVPYGTAPDIGAYEHILHQERRWWHLW